MGSLLCVLEGRVDKAVQHMEGMENIREPEGLVYSARHYSKLGLTDLAIIALKRAAESGFVCAPYTLRSDAWLDGARNIQSSSL